jgi:hypothetical protein
LIDVDVELQPTKCGTHNSRHITSEALDAARRADLIATLKC